jgi:CheY-like chemotaxis protein
VEKMLRRLIGENIELKLELAPDLGTVRADPGQIDQILMNLAVNARDAMPHGGRITIASANVELTDTIAAGMPLMRPGHYVLLSVTDTGVGMDAAIQARIFEPFYTTKPEGKGTGLGLAMVYGTVKQSGGFIWVSSELGKGATFRIYLPRIENLEGSISPSGGQTPSLKGSETILLLEDEEAVRGLASAVLRAFGYEVIECETPENALLIAEQSNKTIHLLLTDVVLPRIDGRQVAEKLTSLRPEMRVLYMSGYTDDSVLRCGVLTAQTAFLQKPFAAKDLAAKVREVLDARTEPGS